MVLLRAPMDDINIEMTGTEICIPGDSKQFFLMFISETERDRAWVGEGRGIRERGRHGI